MKWKTTFVLLIAVVALGAYISMHEIKQPDPEQRRKLEKQVLDFDTGTITQLQIEGPKADFTLRRIESGWVLDPKGVRADPAAANRLASQLSWLSADRVLTDAPDKPLDRAAFGLTAPAARLTVVADRPAATLLFGGKTAVGNNRYVAIEGRPAVYTISDDLFTALDRPENEFRDPMLIDVAADRLSGIDAASPQGSYKLARDEKEGWRLPEPVADKADQEAVSILLNHMGAVRIARFLEGEAQPDPANAGLDPPVASLMLSGNDGAARVLRFGKALPDDATLRYAGRSDEGSLYAVKDEEVVRLFPAPETLRSHACFSFFTEHVTQVEWNHGAGVSKIVKSADGWKDNQGRALDQEAVEIFISSLADLRAHKIIAALPVDDLGQFKLAQPAGAVTVTVKDQPAQRMVVGGVKEGSHERFGILEPRQIVVQLPENAESIIAMSSDAFLPPAVEIPQPEAPAVPVSDPSS